MTMVAMVEMVTILLMVTRKIYSNAVVFVVVVRTTKLMPWLVAVLLLSLFGRFDLVRFLSFRRNK